MFEVFRGVLKGDLKGLERVDEGSMRRRFWGGRGVEVDIAVSVMDSFRGRLSRESFYVSCRPHCVNLGCDCKAIDSSKLRTPVTDVIPHSHNQTSKSHSPSFTTKPPHLSHKPNDNPTPQKLPHNDNPNPNLNLPHRIHRHPRPLSPSLAPHQTPLLLHLLVQAREIRARKGHIRGDGHREVDV